MSRRVHNFSAGPSTLPHTVLEEARDELVEFRGLGMSLLEMSHRGGAYEAVHEETVQRLRTVFSVPEHFELLLLQGGATLQFSMVPLNLLRAGRSAGYVDGGAWGRKALADAALVGDAYAAWTRGTGVPRLPTVYEVELRADTRYLHVTSNETVDGIQLHQWPDVAVPLVVDMSSDIGTRDVPWDRVAVVYAGAQKNLGPAGVTLVFVHREVLTETSRDLGSYLRYDVHAADRSLHNTPPVFSIWLLGKVAAWMARSGGIAAMQQAAVHRSAAVYDAIDASDGFYRSPVDAGSRSRVNVVFRLLTQELEDRFVKDAEAASLVNLRGHRSVGGIRASLYNAMPLEGVDALVSFMHAFRETHA